MIFWNVGAHFGSHFDDFLWEMGSRKNSCKYVAVINFRSLTPWIHGARHDANAISYSWSLEIFLILLNKIHDFKEFKSSRDSFWRSGSLFRWFLRFMRFGWHFRQNSIKLVLLFECSVLDIFNDFFIWERILVPF